MKQNNKREMENRNNAYLRRYVLKKPNTTTKNAKLVYVREQYHERINKIIQVIGKDENTLFGYIDNVLKAHFEQNKEEIERLYTLYHKGIF